MRDIGGRIRWIREAKFPRISDADFAKLLGWHADEMVDYLEGKRQLGITGLVALLSRMRGLEIAFWLCG